MPPRQGVHFFLGGSVGHALALGRQVGGHRENRLCRGALQIGDTLVGPSSLSAPTLAIVNMADEVAPLASLKPFTDAMPAKNARIIEYPGEAGVCLQHLGILVGREAREGLAAHHLLAQFSKLKQGDWYCEFPLSRLVEHVIETPTC